MESKQWYAVYTKPRWEKKVAEFLGRKKIESYCPLNKVVRQWSDRKKTLLEPLFPSYVFVHLAPSELVNAKLTDGVLNYVYWLGRIAVIKEREILAIRDFLGDHCNISLERIPLNVLDEVRITKGPLRLLQGKVHQVLNHTVKVCLPSLGYMMLAEVERSNVEIISSSTYLKKNRAS